MDELVHKKCVPCEGGTEPLPRAEAENYHTQVKDWKLNDKSIERQFEFKDFKAAIAFVNKVADIAEEEGHHPDIHLTGWNKVKLELSTHAIGGLSVNDFVMAAKVDAMQGGA